MKKEREVQIVRLQENLASIRKIAGWTAEELGELLGVSKQNISNLENENTKLSKTQYIAIRHLIEYQAAKKPKNDVLLQIVSLLVDRIDLQGKDYNALKDTAKNIGAAAATMQEHALRIFAQTLLKASYTRASDLTEIDGELKRAIESKKEVDWTAEIFSDGKED